MATAPVTILNFNPGSLTSPFTTASFTPVAGTRLVVFGVSARNAVITIEPTISSTALTWTRIGGNKSSTFSNPDLYIVGWISNVVPASPAAMTVTITNASANAVAACVIQVAGADTDGTVIQSTTGEDLANGDPSYTFAATPGAARLVLGCCWMSGGNAITKPASYVNLFDNTPTNITARRAEVHYAITSPPIGPNTSTSTNIRSIALAIELGVTSGPAGAKNKVWSGSAWVEKPMARWSGSAWVQEAPKVWSGTAWVSSAMPPWTPPAAWQPSNLGASLLGWFDGKDPATVIVTGSGVSTWTNKGAGAFTLTQGTDAWRPLYTANSVNTSGFQWLMGSNGPTDYDFFVVGNPLPGSTPDYRSLIITLDGSNVIATIPNTGSGVDFGVYCGGWGQAGALTWPGQDGLAYGTVKAGFSINLSRDGGALTTTGVGPVSSATGVYGFGSSASYGGGNTISQAFGRVYEFILVPYNSPLDTRQKLEGYSAWKWGLQGLLPAGHPYKAAAP
jgi:hypothetical protein